MASLKDMRVRIAATKATQKITKAMQMVAVSKLRRAQAAAEAARPYAEHMAAVLRNIATSVAGLDSAPALLRGTGSDRVHLLLVRLILVDRRGRLAGCGFEHRWNDLLGGRDLGNH